MYDTHHTITCETHTANAPDISARLNWLSDALARAEQHERLFRRVGDEDEMRLMRRPLSTEEAFARLGLLLGLLPPAAIFYRIFGYPFLRGTFGSGDTFIVWLVICLAMNVTCCLVGRAMGSKMGKHIERFEYNSWLTMPIRGLAVGGLWALITGAAGGTIFFYIGAFFGIICALPVGMLAFALFTPLHRLLARGGMIDARHFWPLAYGVMLFIVALILSPHLIPY